MKRRPATIRGGHDRWLLSYADLVTLLLALFTTLYAASTVDAQKLERVQSSMREAFNAPPLVEPAAPRSSLVPPVAVVAGQASPDGLQLRLQQQLQQALGQEHLEIRRDARGIVVSLPEEAAFGIGKTDMSAEARDVIARIAETVGPEANAIRVEGHTDDTPIRTSRYSSNWELSTARASAVVAYLVEDRGFDPARLSAAGYGEFHPRVPNDSAANRARNRLIDIVILDSTK